MSNSSNPMTVDPGALRPSPSQRVAIEAQPSALLALAGPGAGKTFCLIERIRFLIENHGFAPERICAFTFTNKAAGEIEARLKARLGVDAASRIKRGTIHAFCAELLREFAERVSLDKGFGIADEQYQLGVLRRIEGHRRWHRSVLTRFAAHRFRGDPLRHNDAVLFDQYERFLTQRRLLDFDTLVIKAVELLDVSIAVADIRQRWDVILVDEFQDLNPLQYRVIRALAHDHRHVFAVGDDEQSIYSWAGADPAVFKSFVNDFGLTTRVYLEENHRCPRDVFALARKLVTINTPIFADRVNPNADRESSFPVTAWTFENDEDEMAWLIADICRDREDNDHAWGDVALLYRTHDIGNRLEAGFLSAGVPCRLANGRALSEDPTVAYVIAALRVMANPTDDLVRDAFFAAALPSSLFDGARAQAEATQQDLRTYLNRMASTLPRADETARQVRRALTDWRNLDALAKAHTSLGALIDELLSRRVGAVRSVLDEHSDDISDPALLPDVVALAERLRAARTRGADIGLPRLGGSEIAIKAMLSSHGFNAIRIGDDSAADITAERIRVEDAPSVGIALGIFKALQLIEMAEHDAVFKNFTAIDLETTGRDTTACEIVEIAAVRVRDGRIDQTLHSVLWPRIPIEAQASAVHTLGETHVVGQPRFEEFWPHFRQFCGDDVVVAHNGYEFDFRILKRMVEANGALFDLCTYDTLPLARDLFPASRKLEHLAPLLGVDTGQSHRALDDTMSLALVVVALDDVKRSRARKTALINLLDHLAIALALADERHLCAEALMFREFTRVFALGRYSNCLETYEREQGDDATIPTSDEVIERLGGAALMVRIRTEKTAEDRYPEALARLRRLVADIPGLPLNEQMSVFLERVTLSRSDGTSTERSRVNLLTLHSTKGLEFSRVYVVGVEDSQMPGGTPTRMATVAEVEEGRRLLYVGMTRTQDRLVMTHVATRDGKDTRGRTFLDEMGIVAQRASAVS